jgi:small subunit ribosomal protein S4
LMEKQKAKYTYGVLERQFRNLFDKASRKKGVTGEVLLQLLEARLDNTVFRLGIAPTRRGARQLVSHKHVTVNGVITNVPSYQLRPGDIISVKGKSKQMVVVQDSVGNKSDVRKFGWLEFNPEKIQGVFLEYPERAQIPEKINEQLIVELYSK